MAEHSSLNDIFARLDQSKANRAEEENRKRKLEAEAAEQERREKAAAESAVEKYHVFDDNYDVDDVEDEPVVMIPQNNPSAPEAKNSASVQQPVTKQDMDEISDGNPFVQNLFKRPHKQAKLPIRNVSPNSPVLCRTLLLPSLPRSRKNSPRLLLRFLKRPLSSSVFSPL